MGGYISVGFCFPAEATVTLKSGDKKTMQQLEIGDEVLVRKGGVFKYEKVYNFLHHDANIETNFLQLICESGKRITLTPNHLLHKINGTIVPAHSIVKGDKLVSKDGEEQVVEIQTKQLQGVYAPVTFSGTIVVDDILASCYAEFDSKTNHKLAHAALKPLRAKAKLAPTTTKKNGVNNYCKFIGNVVYPVYKAVAL